MKAKEQVLSLVLLSLYDYLCTFQFGNWNDKAWVDSRREAV